MARQHEYSWKPHRPLGRSCDHHESRVYGYGFGAQGLAYGAQRFGPRVYGLMFPKGPK